MPRDALRTASRIVGSMQALAEKLKITKGAVGQWDKVPSERVIDVAKATDWQVTPHQLRPDIYPNPSDALPPDRVADACHV